MKRNGSSESPAAWTFLSNHGHVLVCIARDANVRVREIAQAVGVTERAVQRILRELEEAGVIVRTRQGRRTHYEVNEGIPLRHPIESEHSVGELVRVVRS
ncbi:MAG: winged helix-turn-helix domain-containing protein [Deltaproteobacteria bacterium]|nr:winged helix-turn-helix domain-containing protein [Deltaproteobacteria bacterium]NND30237.1 winged helix-turn-helix transcriptional regulator [Myxococcales bacterium]MBT8465830.1 winged helix-turn-helix domain-containing protein [Deltaproteobacteria bacterium]MBT8481022.1 winged helix-turn-helix domain-containing protein [Deltaproteobacteria bacterium]NNK07374.1 winged helix-turn-helix transcriptional regulator [Myxococcales bacterium]